MATYAGLPQQPARVKQAAPLNTERLQPMKADADCGMIPLRLPLVLRQRLLWKGLSMRCLTEGKYCLGLNQQPRSHLDA